MSLDQKKGAGHPDPTGRRLSFNLDSISGVLSELLEDKYDCEDRGMIEIKGKGQKNTYLLEGRKA